MTPETFRNQIILPTLEIMNLNSENAVRLLLATAMTESNLTGTYQVGGGPALGPYQMEYTTANDLYHWTMRHRKGLMERLHKIEPEADNFYLLAKNPHYATAMARLLYLSIPEPLPDAHDFYGTWRYYKAHWNSPKGKATIEHFKTATAGIWDNNNHMEIA